ncbi:PQQ-dependent sugar dehydrogenase [Propioniciclava soli]|uniref:PQQ-dependent sugar dehydrogenase n=1 Tax=Propioniciclava soli TaxID=2775081 RepID=UPI001E548B8C|nr:PQQ-dependent sugar dehydrogenase [Propioniciclava soli]
MRPRTLASLTGVFAWGLAACAGPTTTPDPTTAPEATTPATTPATSPATPAPTTADGAEMPLGPDGRPFTVAEVATFDTPWAMAFLPGTQTALVTEREGVLHLVDTASGEATEVEGIPDVVASGQGGLGDVLPGPTFEQDGTVYLSWVESGSGGTGAVVGRAELITGDAPRLEGLAVIWEQTPKVSGNGHFSHRLAFSPDGQHLFVSSGDRQEMTPAQDPASMLGTIMRMNTDGSDAQIWTNGHRNPLGLAFDADGNLWSSEMGPQGGDELNLIVEGANYGWPEASMGVHYNGTDIPDHTDGDGFEAPVAYWVPAMSPGSLMIYTDDAFSGWTGDAFLGGLSGQNLVRVDLDGTTGDIADTWDMGQRIREVEQGPDGSVWLLEDAPGGRLLHLTPVS